ncbi:DUF2336 domain-containing protein [Dongia deserti]|uniref:DUF2336 domain-containing protein n=1 Tax=Dongia deserti TaxID=2268030 RepID=UPI000E64D51E|nr:DUF2336 domain-containing protein [Dongia deserti]
MSNDVDYEQAKLLSTDPDAKVRRTVAEQPDAKPEILFYLADDADAGVRCAVAANKATPRQADLILTRDEDDSVRERLAAKISALVPDIANEERAKIRALSSKVLETLARDQAVRVRQIVAEALQDSVDAPVAVIQKLARDIEIQVAGPILEHSPLLTDEDLLEIIAAGPIRGALTAIAKRRQVSEKLSGGVVSAALSDPAESNTVRRLLQNKSAQIREDTLDLILDQAGRIPTWHEPLVERPTLPMKAIKRLAAFVSRSLLEALQRRPDLDAATAKDVAKAVQRRLEAEGAAAEAPPVGEDAIAAAIGAGKRDAVAAALARDAKLPAGVVSAILASKSAKAVTALAWRAKLSMRQALQLQLRIAHIPPTAALNPRGGSDYPLTPAEMEWQLGLFGTA